MVGEEIIKSFGLGISSLICFGLAIFFNNVGLASLGFTLSYVAMNT